MPLLVSDILDEARNIYLNDRDANTYTNSILTPHIKAAWELLQVDLLENGLTILSEESATILVAAGAVTLALPSDFVYPIRLMERAVGETDEDWESMTESWWDEPAETQEENLNVWAWRENEVKFVGATSDREVKLLYRKLMADIVTTGDTLTVNRAFKSYLAPKVSALAAGFNGSNPTRAAACEDIAEKQVHKIINILIKKQQSTPVRRPGINLYGD